MSVIIQSLSESFDSIFIKWKNDQFTKQNKFYYQKRLTFHFWLLQRFFYNVSSSITIWKNRMKVKKTLN